MQQIERKNFEGIITGADEGYVEAIVSVYGNIDSYNERVMYGAFEKSIANKYPTGVLAHDWDNPVAVTVAIEELPAGDPRLPEKIRGNGGLFVRGQFFEDIPSSWEAYLKIKRKLFREFSIGYNVVRDGYKDGVRELYELELHEWSPVLVGANPATSTLAVKGIGFDDRIETLVTAIQDMTEQTKARAEMRLKAGRVLSQRNVGALQGLAATLAKARKDILRILNEAAPEPKEGKNAPEMEAARLAILRNYLESFKL
jgi:HK97 family phage prohead protease